MDSEEECAAAAVIIAVISKRRKERKKMARKENLGKNRGCEEGTIWVFIILLSRNFKLKIDLNTRNC